MKFLMVSLTSKAQNHHLLLYIKGAYKLFCFWFLRDKLVQIDSTLNSGLTNPTYLFQMLEHGTKNRTETQKWGLDFFELSFANYSCKPMWCLTFHHWLKIWYKWGISFGKVLYEKPPQKGSQWYCLQALLAVSKLRTMIAVLKKLSELCNSMSSFI